MFSVLYVDDERDLLEIGKIFLEQFAEFSVDTHTSAQEALASPKFRSYDAIISDYQMPGIDGIEFLRIVRAQYGDIPFILFTGRGREEIVIQAINSGADFYLQKGGDPRAQFAELVHKVRQAVARRRTEFALIESEKRLFDIINFLPDATFAIDRSGRVIAWNRAIEDMTGIPASEMLGKGDFEYSIPFYGIRRPILIDLIFEPDVIIAKNYMHIVQEKGVLIADTHLPRPKGRTVTLLGKASPLYNRQGEIVGAIESIRDITELKKVEEELRAEEEKYRVVVENSHETIYIYRNDRFLFVNSRASELTGYSHDELMNKEVWDFVHPDDRARLQDSGLRRISGEQIPSVFSARILTKTGDERDGEFFVGRIIYQGQPAILGIVREITEQKQADEKLRESEGIFTSFMNYLPVTAFIKDQQSSNLFVNKQMEDLFGAREWIGKSVSDIFPAQAAEKMIADDRLVLKNGYLKTLEPLRVKNGDIRIFETYKFRIDREKKPPLIGGFSVDITARVHAEEEVRAANEQIAASSEELKSQFDELVKSEQRIRDSERKYRTVFETTGTATVLIEDDATILLANSEFERLSGYPYDEIEDKKKWTEFVAAEDLDWMLVQHRLRRKDPANALKHYEFRFRSRQGDIRNIYITIDIIPGTTRSVASLLDITERKQAEESLIAANKEYMSLLDQIQDVYYRSDTEGRLIQASQSLVKVLGYDDLSECIGRSIADNFWFNPHKRQNLLEEIYRDGKVTNYWAKMKKKDGSAVLVETSSHLYYDPAGNILGVEGTFRDITERKQQEFVLSTQLELGLTLQEIRGMNDTLEACLNSAIRISGMDAGGIYLVDRTSGSVDLAVSRNLGDDFIKSASHYPAGSVNAQIVMAGRPIYNQLRDTSVVSSPVQEREGLNVIGIIPITSGGRVTACLNLTSHSQGQIPVRTRVAVETIATQIGTAIERIMAEEALADSEKRYRDIVEDQTEFISRFRPDGTHVFVNEAYSRYFGFARNEILGSRFRPVIPREDQERVRRFFASLTPSHPVDTIEHRIIMPDSQIRWQRWSDRAIFDHSGRLIEYQSVGRDVTETKRAELALSLSEEKYRRILENMRDSYIRSDINGNIVMVNPAAVRLYGYSSADEMIGIPATSLYRYPERRRDMFRRLKEQGNLGDFEGEALRKDGSSFLVSLSAQFTFDDQGTIQGLEAIVRDITDRKMMEQSVQEANRKLNLLNSITRHDVANQISIVRGFTKIAQKKEDDTVVKELLGKIDTAAAAIAWQIAFTKSYQELGRHTPCWNRIDEIVAKLKPDTISVTSSCTDIEIFADPMLEKVFFNLFDNAVRHGKSVTAVTVRCERVPDGLVVVVEDNGCGILAEEKEKIFERGFGKNTGLGLFLAREILTITGITIRETGVPGKGARFEMLVPTNAFRVIT